MPTILSVCLVSMEPDGVLRVMSDQYTPDERFGGSAAQCALSTPRDATATHILVFPTSATAQVSILVFLTFDSVSGPAQNSILVFVASSITMASCTQGCVYGSFGTGSGSCFFN